MRPARARARARARGAWSEWVLIVLLFGVVLLLVALGWRDGPVVHGRRLLFVAPRFDGFSNQRITIVKAAFCATKTNRVLVLPPIYQNKTYLNHHLRPPQPFSLFFSVADLQMLVPVLAPDDTQCSELRLLRDSSGLCPSPAPVYKFMQHKLGLFSRITCLDGPSKAEPCLGVGEATMSRLCPRLAASGTNSLFGRYSDYGRDGQGYSVHRSSKFARIHRHFRPSTVVVGMADEILRVVERSIGSEFAAVHIRRGDFISKCKDLPRECERFGSDSMFQSSQFIAQTIGTRFSRRGSALLVLTDDPEGVSAMNLSMVTGLNVHVPEGQLGHQLQRRRLENPDVYSFSMQLIAAMAATDFVGSRFSSFSSEIINLRRESRKPSAYW